MKMSADEDTELRDLVAQTLESNGTLGKLRAQLRASVFLALEDQENGQSKTPFLNKELKSFLLTKEGRLTANLVQEFLEFFNLEFTLAVFKPETGLADTEKRAELARDLNLSATNPPSGAPLITSLLSEGRKTSKVSNGSGDSGEDLVKVAKDLTEKQIEDARAKFEYYDKDNNGSIDKDELRELFIDIFPAFHRNMLERYVNDEFKAVDKDFSSSIDFDEFLGMYKRLFLFCRTVVAGDVSDIVSPSHKAGAKKLPSSAHSTAPASQLKPAAQNGPQGPANPGASGRDHLGSDVEEDPFFDDLPTSPVSFNTLSSVPANSVSKTTRKATPYRPSQIPRFQKSELEKSKETASEKRENGDSEKNKGKASGSGMTSLDGLPSLTSGRGMGSLAGAPPVGRPKSPTANQNNQNDLDQNLRAIDKRIVEMGLGDSQNDDFEYEDDFSEHSLSQKTGSKMGGKQENGSIAEEIDDEEIEDISIEADDLLHSEKSGFDDLTTDRSISQADGGFDYMEDPVSP